MTASSEPTPPHTYLPSGASVPPYRTSTPATPEPAPAARLTIKPSPLQQIRDVALILASLCVVATTIATVFAVLTLGHALSQVGDRLDTPTPEVSCDPTYFNC